MNESKISKQTKYPEFLHVPDNNLDFSLLKFVSPGFEPKQKYININYADTLSNSLVSESTPPPYPGKSDGVSIRVFGRSIAVKLPKNDLDTRFLLKFRYSRWDKKQFCWIVPNYPGNLDLITDFFKDRIIEFVINEPVTENTATESKREVGNDEILLIKTNAGRLKLFFVPNNELMMAVRSIPYCLWNNHSKSWSVPFADKFLNKIKCIAELQNLKITYEEEEKELARTLKISKFDIPNYRKCPEEYILKLKELRYSERTILVYRNSFEEFINFYNQFEIDDIQESMISDFLRYLVIERKISTSYQNQAINAVKFYYERVLGGERKIYLIDRPREEKTLPVVMNEKEVSDLFKATENLKHRAVLMLCYSAGLRLSELVNIKIKDIDSERMQVRIAMAKGKKDRYSILSPKLLDILRVYFLEYKPKIWLFEGREGGQYSRRSIQLIMKGYSFRWICIHTQYFFYFTLGNSPSTFHKKSKLSQFNLVLMVFTHFWRDYPHSCCSAAWDRRIVF